MSPFAAVLAVVVPRLMLSHQCQEVVERMLSTIALGEAEPLGTLQVAKGIALFD
jgi:hypothetical protein